MPIEAFMVFAGKHEASMHYSVIDLKEDRLTLERLIHADCESAHAAVPVLRIQQPYGLRCPRLLCRLIFGEQFHPDK